MNLQVVYDDLLNTSRTFHAQAQVHSEIIPIFIRPPSVVDETLDAAIQAVLQSISLMGEMLSKSMDGHGAKLKIAYDNYRHNEKLTSEQLFQVLQDPDTLG